MVKTRSLWCAVPVAVIAVLVALFVRDATNTSIEGLQLQGKRVVVCGASMGIGTLHLGLKYTWILKKHHLESYFA